jgi:predicted TIM-barrel fold metal-dependent hydrolase
VTAPFDGGVIDLMVALPPAPGDESWRDQLRPLLKDPGSASFTHPASYLYRNLPAARFADDPVRAVLDEMDRFGVERALVGVDVDQPASVRAALAHPDRFLPSIEVDPSAGVDGVRRLRAAVDGVGVRAATAFTAGVFPQRALDEPAWFPLYAACVDLAVPLFVTVGIPGPRVPGAPQAVLALDTVCFEFPDLVVVMRHGAEPWAELAVKLMLKWPGLHYSTSAFAPRYYPRPIVDFANTRGREKVCFAGYFPMGLSYEMIFEQLPNVPFRPEVWPAFLRDNARRLLGV